jgi:hypothetical protein
MHNLTFTDPAQDPIKEGNLKLYIQDKFKYLLTKIPIKFYHISTIKDKMLQKSNYLKVPN